MAAPWMLGRALQVTALLEEPTGLSLQEAESRLLDERHLSTASPHFGQVDVDGQ